MSSTHSCPSCGAALPGNAPGGHCPVCLLKLALATAQADAGETAPVSPPDAPMVANYQILRPLGEGGCGTVYLAEQLHPVRRQVALKVIKLGMDTKSVIARFEAERQALALMDHPGIAKVRTPGRRIRVVRFS